jgi:glutathione-regulated potassium-efflux system ancillary protein KefC
MELSTALLAIIIIIAATAICVVLFERLGFGAILGFIVAGIAIGPHTPGPVPVHAVDRLQDIADLGVVLFMFTIGLEMRPRKVWAMRRLIFGLGSAQVAVTAAVLTAYLLLTVAVHWQSALIIGLAFALSSTAIVMATLGERGELSQEHGQTSFAVLMAQDMWVVPLMALVPILAHTQSQTSAEPLWQKAALIVAVIAGIGVIGRLLLPAALLYCARRRQMSAFTLVLFLAVLFSAWAVDKVGISMTLGAFLLGVLLSVSDLRYQIETSIAPIKEILMGLFFIAVGMSIDVGAVVSRWDALLFHVPIVLLLKTLVLILLAGAFGVSRQGAIRTGFYCSQVGEFAFVLLGAASLAGLISDNGHTLAMLVVAVSMIATPLMVKAGAIISSRLDKDGKPSVADSFDAKNLDRHVVIIGYDVVGNLIDEMLERAKIPHLAVDRDLEVVQSARRAGRQVIYGDMRSTSTQKSVGLERAKAVYLTAQDFSDTKALAITLRRFYPSLDIYVRVKDLSDQEELVSKGIRHAATGYIESTLARGGVLLKDLGVPEEDVIELVNAFREKDYALVRSTYVGNKTVPK